MMTENLSYGAIGQIVDDDGKCRAIKYEDGLCLMVPPLAPLNLPEIDKISLSSVKTAVVFAKKKGLKLIGQKIVEEQSHGLWFTSDILSLYYAYIPIHPSQKIKNVEESDRHVPFIDVNKISLIEKFRQGRRISDIFQQYTQYIYSYHANGKDLSLEDFEKMIVIKADHSYDLQKLGKKLFVEGNDIMLDSKKRLIVQSQKVKDALLKNLGVALLNDRPGIIDMKDQTFMSEVFKTISDFDQHPDQLIFLNKNGLQRWARGKFSAQIQKNDTDIEVIDYFKPYATDPYFFRHPYLKNGRLILIQNIPKSNKSDLAAFVSRQWSETQVNEGYDAVDSKNEGKDISRIIYYPSFERTVEKRKTTMYSTVIQYDPERYAAVLLI